MAGTAGIVNNRGKLENTIGKLRSGSIAVGFLGGSITDGRGGNNWPEPVMRWLVDRYPATRFHVENGGIGATGSDLAAFRAQRDIIDRGCDLVFVEYAVNDLHRGNPERLRSREGLLRQLLADGRRDVVLTYTYSQPMYETMAAGGVPDSIVELETLARHYGLSTVWMGKYALEEVKRGFLRWEEWLPDGLHPTERGSLSYGESVIALLREALPEQAEAGEIAAGRGRESAASSLPEPLDPGNWQHVKLVPFEAVATEGPWMVKRGVTVQWIDRTLSTSAIGAKLSFAFEGVGLCLGFDFGKLSSEFRYRLDGSEWQTMVRERPDWCGPSGWFKLETLYQDLPRGAHRFELEVTHGDRADCAGTRFDLALIGVMA